MRRLYFVLLVCGLLLASPAFAQEQRGWDKRVFGFAGGGNEINYSSFFHAGGGFEAISPSGIGFVIDLGYLQYAPDGYGNVSLTAAVVYELPLEGKLRPYALGGLGAISDTVGYATSATVWEVGGGFNYWFHQRLGLKAEVRGGGALGYVKAYPYEGLIEGTFGVMYRF